MDEGHGDLQHARSPCLPEQILERLVPLPEVYGFSAPAWPPIPSNAGQCSDQKTRGRLQKFMAELGLSPASRSRVTTYPSMTPSHGSSGTASFAGLLGPWSEPDEFFDD